MGCESELSSLVRKARKLVCYNLTGGVSVHCGSVEDQICTWLKIVNQTNYPTEPRYINRSDTSVTIIAPCCCD